MVFLLWYNDADVVLLKALSKDALFALNIP